MARRLELHQLLETITPHVYFQPPSTIHLEYPCIIYKRDMSDVEYANNRPYSITTRYSVTVIDRNPDSEIPEKVASLPTSLFNRFYTADNLNHDVYTLYY